MRELSDFRLCVRGGTVNLMRSDRGKEISIQYSTSIRDQAGWWWVRTAGKTEDRGTKPTENHAATRHPPFLTPELPISHFEI